MTWKLNYNFWAPGIVKLGRAWTNKIWFRAGFATWSFQSCLPFSRACLPLIFSPCFCSVPFTKNTLWPPWILNDIEWWSLRWSRVRADDWAVEVCRSRSWLLQRAVQAWVRGWRPVPESTSSKSYKQPQQKGKHDPHPILSVFLSVCFYMNLCFQHI